jgi:L-cysteine:1D-myo-inositol 2-amino-2-deoxy-alpha-D-glucopyranoside ligase
MVAVGPESGEARFYACGITPYDSAHLGHAFTYVVSDLLHRVWLDAGLGVHYTQNITDVDDPLLERAKATGVEWEELAHSQIDLFAKDMEALRVIPPQTYTGVVESMDETIALVGKLVELGAAYQICDAQYPDWYFSVEQAPDFLEQFLPTGVFASLGAKTLDIFAERGGDPFREGKRHPLDCLIWRMERPGEPAWESPFGRGRPGWHIECAAISLASLGPHFDVQAGGSDLYFPHHPMCAAEAEKVTGQPFASAYLHVGMVGLDGEKMSKSKGNLVFVHKLIDAGVSPMSIRLLLLKRGYVTNWGYTETGLAAAADRAQTWQKALSRPAAPPAAPVIAAMRQALANDLDAPKALAAVDEWASLTGTDETAPAALADAIDALLGLRW